jgi:peptide deformylase
MYLSNELVKSTHPLLTTELEPFDFENSPVNPQELGDHLIEVMDKHNGIGLSANQLGLPYRVFVLRTEPRLVCFNPVITFESDEQSVLEEGCLTFPSLYVKIRRSEWIRTKFMDVNGELQTEKFGGITARCFQHELDHLNGIVYLSRASNLNLQRAKRKLKLLNRRKKRLNNIPMMMNEE